MNRRLISAVLAVLVAGALAGCAPTPDLSDDAAEGLQASVQSVAGAAAAGDPTAAASELDALQTKLDGAVSSDDVSDDRAQSIQAAIDLVRADLEQQVADAAAEAERVAAQQAELDRVAAEEAAAEQTAADKAAADKAAQDAKGPEGPKDPKDDKGNPGKGNDD